MLEKIKWYNVWNKLNNIFEDIRSSRLKSCMSLSSYEIMIIIQLYFLSSTKLFESQDINYLRI